MTGFTFYADLLGVSSLYQLGPDLAYKHLNEFYNTCFYSIEEWAQRSHAEVFMFSDSLLVWGTGPEQALSELSLMYMKLLHKGLLLRGAMVKGALTFDPRLTRRHFQKYLPTDDTLARAVGLEKSYRGARLLIETTLARHLLRRNKGWLTQDGYVREPDPRPKVSRENVLRRICPAPDGKSYEALYFWVPHVLAHAPVDYDVRRATLAEVGKMQAPDIARHYDETVALLTRCQARQSYTEGLVA